MYGVPTSHRQEADHGHQLHNEAVDHSPGCSTQPLLSYPPYIAQFEQHKGMGMGEQCGTTTSSSLQSTTATHHKLAPASTATASTGDAANSSGSWNASSRSDSSRPRHVVTFEGVESPKEACAETSCSAQAEQAAYVSTSRGPTAASAAVARRQQQLLAAAASSSTSSEDPGTAAGDSTKRLPGNAKARAADSLFGPGHVHGVLHHPSDDGMVTNLPFKTGTAFSLRPARMRPSSCVPPPFVEPLQPVAADTRARMELHDTRRLQDIGSVLNRLVYDSLEQPSTAGSSGSDTDTRRRTEDITPGSTVPCCDYHHDLPAWLALASAQDTTLVFESRFECGNLRRVVQVFEYEYDLILQPDLNTRAHTQWYYFAVSNARAGVPYKFNIINLMKEDSLYNHGMLPLVHSEKTLASTGLGWHRSGKDVCYYPNSLHRRKQHYRTLTFTLTFQHDRDVVHIAHCYPYTYSDLQRALWAAQQQQQQQHQHQHQHHHKQQQLQQQQQQQQQQQNGHARGIMTRATLCRTLANNVCDVLTITAPSECGIPLDQRRGIVLSARVHPGETNASWMMKGALEFLLGPTADAQRLRETFVFKVVPMLNPDGVITGNYRCSLAGLDLNRVWQEPDEKVQPTIRAFKAMLKDLVAERQVALFCDLHGHSRKFGIFIYGCEKRTKDAAPAAPGWPVPGSLGGLDTVPTRHQDKVFPLLLHLAAPDLFSFRSCNFKVQKSKAGTGRVVGWRELGLVNAFTMEASFCGASTGQYAQCHFNTGHLEQMGAALCATLLEYWEPSSGDALPELLSQLDAVQGMKASQVPADWAGSELVMDEDDNTCTDSDDESSDEADEDSSSPAAGARVSRDGRSSGAGSTAAAAASAAAALASGAPLSSLSTSSAVALLSGMSATSAVALLRSSTGGEGLQLSLQPLLRGSIDWRAVAHAASSAAASGGSNWRAAAAATAAAVAVECAGRTCSTGSSTAAGSAPMESSARKGPLSSPLPVAMDHIKRTRSAGSLAGMAQSSEPLPRAGRDRSHLLDTWPKNNSTSDPGASVGAKAAVQAGQQPHAHKQGSCLDGATASSISGGAPQDSMSSLPLEMLVMAPDGSKVPLVALLLAGMATTPDADAAAVAANAVASAAAAAAVAGAGGGKVKKGRRKGLARYGNPEFLRAERAKADAGLAATLPLLAERDVWTAHQAAAAACGTSGCGGLPGQARRDSASDDYSAAAGGYLLDLERYEGLLAKQRRQVGGVLASSHDPSSAGAGALAAGGEGAASRGGGAATTGHPQYQRVPWAAPTAEPVGQPRRRSKSADTRLEWARQREAAGTMLRAVGPGVISRSPLLQSAHH